MPDKPLLPFLGDDDHLRRILIMIGYMIIAAGFAVAVVLAWPLVRWVFGLLSPFLVALVVAYIFNPVVNFVQYRLRLSRIYGVVLVNLIVLLVAALFIAIIIPILASQTKLAWMEIRIFVRDRAAPWVVEQIGASETPSADLALAVARAADEWFPETGGVTAEDLVGRVLELSRESEEATEEGARNEETELLAVAIRAWFEESQAETVEREQFQEWLGRRSDEWREAEGSRRLASRIEEWMDSRELTAAQIVESALGSAEFRSAAQSAAAGSAGVIGWLVGSLVAAVTWLVSSVVFLAFVILLSFYLLVDFASLRGAMEVVCPSKWRGRFFDVLGKVDVAVGGFIRGQLTVAFLVGLLTAVGLFLLGMKQYAVLIGVIAGLGNMIPFFGPVIGGTPAVLYVLLSDGYSDERLLFLGLVVGWFVLIQTMESLVFQPYIVGAAARLHPVIVIMAVAIGAQFGLMGALLALPVTSIARVLLKEFYWDERMASWQKATGRKRLDELPRQARRKKRSKAAG
jgi:predicted PurR-regulated permease PerM